MHQGTLSTRDWKGMKLQKKKKTAMAGMCQSPLWDVVSWRVVCPPLVGPVLQLELFSPSVLAQNFHNTVDNGVVLNLDATHGVHTPKGHLCRFWA